MNVGYERHAEDDLRRILKGSGHPDPVRFAKMLRLRIAALALFPESGRLLPGPSIREWKLHGTRYVVLYATRASGVDILRVIDSAWRTEIA